MIKQIDLSNLDEIVDIVDRFAANQEGPPPSVPLLDQIKAALEKERIEVWVSYDDKVITGFVTINLVRNAITVLYVDKKLESLGEDDVHQLECVVDAFLGAHKSLVRDGLLCLS